jgi:hypothetical protein
VEDDKDVLNDRVDMVPLRDVYEKESTLFENPDILAEKPLGIGFSEVFEEALMENYIESGIREWE